MFPERGTSPAAAGGDAAASSSPAGVSVRSMCLTSGWELGDPVDICSLACSQEGARFACTMSAIHTLDAQGRRCLIAGHPDEMGHADGAPSAARFNCPMGLTVDEQGGSLWVADTNNHRLRRVDLRTGQVSTVAGGLHEGAADGVGASALFRGPWGVAMIEGALFVADAGNGAVRKLVLLPCGRCRVSTLTLSRSFGLPQALAAGGNGKVIVVDAAVHAVCEVDTTSGIVEQVAGGAAGFADGPCRGKGACARFNDPGGVAVDGVGNIFVADKKNHRIRMISGGTVATLAGSGKGRMDGAGDCARFNQPFALAVDKRQLLVADSRIDEGLLRVVRQDWPWSFARILFIGCLKCRPPHPAAASKATKRARTTMGDGAAGCALALLPVEGSKGLASPLLWRILEMVRVRLDLALAACVSLHADWRSRVTRCKF